MCATGTGQGRAVCKARVTRPHPARFAVHLVPFLWLGFRGSHANPLLSRYVQCACVRLHAPQVFNPPFVHQVAVPPGDARPRCQWVAAARGDGAIAVFDADVSSAACGASGPTTQVRFGGVARGAAVRAPLSCHQDNAT